jgi:transposase
METVAHKKPRPRSFTPDFRAEIVQRCRQGNRSIAQVAKDFNLVESTVRHWVEQADIPLHGEGTWSPVIRPLPPSDG